jgi:hypothetical protein
MAFDPSQLSLAVDSIAGGSIRIHFYKTEDTEATVVAAGYMTQAARYGLRVGDLIMVANPESLGDGRGAFTVSVDSITAGGAAVLVQAIITPDDVVGLVDAITVPTQEQAETGVFETGRMTPLRTKQQIDARLATETEAEAGTNAVKLLTPLRGMDLITARGKESGFTPTGTGAVATTVDARLKRLTVDVRDFGAAGDGVADDKAEFDAAAVEAGSGGNVEIPRGTFNLATDVAGSGRFWTIRGVLSGAGRLWGNTVSWVRSRGEPVTLDMVFGGFLSHVTYFSRQATAHLDSRATVAIQRREVGSTANGPENAGYALVVNTEKESFLTSAVEGEVDGQYIIVRQGQKDDVGGLLIDVAKVGGDTGGVTSIEAASQWVDSAGATVNRLQTIKGYLGQTSAFYGVTGTSGIGFWAEAQTGPHFAAFAADQVGSGSVFENLIYYTSGRDIANLIYRVDGIGKTHGWGGTAASPSYSFRTDPDTGFFRVGDNAAGIATGGALRFYADSAGSTLPGSDNVYNIGAAAARFVEIFAVNATINTSDEREKQDIAPIPDEWLDAWGDVQWVQYRWKGSAESKGDAARWHSGLIAQRVRDVFTARGIDPFAIALLCYDEWDAKDATLDDDGNETLPARVAGNRFGLRYEQCLAIEAAYQRRRADRAENMTFNIRYVLMTTDQAPPAVIAEWLTEPLFAAYVARERKRG